MKKRSLLLFFFLAIILIRANPAQAQTYLFSLDSEIVQAYWQEDGTLTLFYEFNFSTDAFSDPIDFVDVGIPTNDYSLANISASINGRSISHIEYSQYVSGAVELGLGVNSIQPGQSGQVTVAIIGIGSVLQYDDDDENYASAVFSPTWFGSEFVYGTTDITIEFHLPPGVQPAEPRWHGAPSGFPTQPNTSLDSQGRVTYTWRNSSANAYTQYLFGASFPKQYVPESAIYTPPPFEIDIGDLISWGILCVILFFMIGIPIFSVISARRRKMKYLPPKVAIEGHGIKRGLTAIEAAILLEEPMDKILTMILFAVIKKSAAKVTKRDPLSIQVSDPVPKNLRKYELDFLEAYQSKSKAKRKKAMQTTMIALVKSVTRKMKGFSRKETIKYYRDIMARAWKQVEDANTPEIMSEKYDEVMEWTMLDDDYADRTRNIFAGRPVFIPHWWHNYDPGYTRSVVSRPASSAPSKSSGTSTPRLPGSDFAASIVNGVENFSAGAIGSLRDFTGGVTKKTNPPPVSTSSYSGGGSSSSCACACACAGCACACAGGGR